MVISTKKETKNLEKKRLNDKMYDQKKKKKNHLSFISKGGHHSHFRKYKKKENSTDLSLNILNKLELN